MEKQKTTDNAENTNDFDAIFTASEDQRRKLESAEFIKSTSLEVEE